MSPCNVCTVNNNKICMGCNDYNRFECDLTTDRDRLQAEVKDYKNKANDLFAAVLKKNVELSTMTVRCNELQAEVEKERLWHSHYEVLWRVKCNELDTMTALYKAAEEDARILATHIYEWCKAIDENGGGWDFWDDYYKDAYWNENTDVYKATHNWLTLKKEE